MSDDILREMAAKIDAIYEDAPQSLYALGEAVQSLVNAGIYSVYSCKDGKPAKYILFPGTKCACCNPSTGPEAYLLDENGTVKDQLDHRPVFEIDKMFRFKKYGGR